MFTTTYVPNGTRNRSRSTNHYPDSTASQWRDLFVFHCEALSSAARILTQGPCSPAVVLINAESKIRYRDIPEGFRYRYAIRTVVLAALVMPSLEECPDGLELFDCGSADLAHFEDGMAALPYRERCVLFLRDVLDYSRREAALLLSMSDSRVDDLLHLGRNRLLLKGPVTIERIRRHFDAVSLLAQDNVTGDSLRDYA